MANEKRVKPLLFGTQPETEIEQMMEQPTYAAAANDLNWIPGYSEMVRAHDLQTAEYGSMAYRQREKLLRELGVSEVKPLPVKYKWVRVTNYEGLENDNVRVDLGPYRRDGYRFAKTEDLQKYGHGVPAAAHIAADGTIRRGDTALMVVDAARAAENAIRRAQEIADLEGVVSGAETGAAIEVQRTGADRNFTLPAR